MGPGYESVHYGINNMRPTKSESDDVYWANIERDTAIQTLQNLLKKCIDSHSYIFRQIFKPLNSRMLIIIGPVYTKLRDFEK